MVSTQWNKGHTNPFYNLAALWKHYTEGQKPDTGGHIVYGSFHVIHPEEANPYSQKKVSSYQETGGKMRSDYLMGKGASLRYRESSETRGEHRKCH